MVIAVAGRYGEGCVRSERRIIETLNPMHFRLARIRHSSLIHETPSPITLATQNMSLAGTRTHISLRPGASASPVLKSRLLE